MAARAGVSIGTLYQYFSDKHAIARALVERHLAGMLSHVDAWAARVLATEPGLRRALRSLMETALAAHEDQPRLHRVLLEEAPLPAEVHDLVRRAERDAARTVAGVLRHHGEVGRRDLLRAGQLIVWLATDFTHRFAADPGRMGRAAFLSEATDLCEAYARSQDGAAEGAGNQSAEPLPSSK